MNRREFIKTAGLGSASLAALPTIVSPALANGPVLNFRSIDVKLTGVTLTATFGINPQRDIVGDYRVGVPPAPLHGFVLSQGQFITIDYPGAAGTMIEGVSPSGDIVGVYTDPVTSLTRAFVRHIDGTFVPIDFPDSLVPPGARPNNTIAIKTSPTGKVVGCFHHTAADVPMTMHGYIFQDGGFAPHYPLPGSMHNGITHDGRTIVGVNIYAIGLSHAYLLQDGVYQVIDPPNSISADARDVSPTGEIVGLFADLNNTTHGFLLNKDGYTTIDFPGPGVIATRAFGINPQGDIVGTYADARGTHGFVATRSQGQDRSLIIPDPPAGPDSLFDPDSGWYLGDVY